MSTLSRRLTPIAGVLTAVAASLALACGATKETEVPPASTTVITFDTTTIPDTLSVGTKVTARIHVVQDSVILPNANVLWIVSAGGGTVSAANGTTDANGDASVEWTMGTLAGVNNLDAIVNNTPRIYSTVAIGSQSDSLARVSVDSSVVVAGGTVALTVKTIDAYGNGVGGVHVTWATTGGTLSLSSSGNSGSNGNASAALTTGAAGVYTVTATIADTPTPVTFTITAQ